MFSVWNIPRAVEIQALGIFVSLAHESAQLSPVYEYFQPNFIQQVYIYPKVHMFLVR